MSKLKIKVLFLTNIPSPYMVGYLNELGKYVDLTVVFEKACDSSRPDSWQKLLNQVNFAHTVLRGKAVSSVVYGDNEGSAPDDKAFSPSVIKYLNKAYDFIIVANPCTPTGITAILWMRIRHISYSIQSEGGIPGDGKSFKEKVKRFLMKRADWYFSTCDLDDKYFIQYGATTDRIRRYPFASIKEEDLPKKMIDEASKKEFKNALRIDTPIFILSVGRSVYVKGWDVLLNAIPIIKSNNVTVGFVGGLCTEEYKKIIDNNSITNARFIDNVDFEELRKYYSAADIFVLPTRSDTWGLVVNEAMAFGLPVITTDMCVAGNALITEGVNGFLVPTENPKLLAEKVNYLIKNKVDRNRISYNNFCAMRKWTYEEMGRVMGKHIEEIVGNL